MKPKTEFITGENAATLYVNGAKTNIWYWLPTYKYFNQSGICNDVEARQKAETIKLLIDTGQITGITNWENWDHCAFCSVDLIEITVVDSIDWKNKMHSSTGSDYSDINKQIATVHDLMGTTQSTQWTKRIIGNSISHKIGIAFYPFGYDIGFI